MLGKQYIIIDAALPSDVERLLKEARAFLEAGLREFGEAIGSGDVISIRDSAEKAWNAVVQATNALILALTEKMPMSHFERRNLLRELEKRDPEVRRLGFRDRYMARYRILHGETFYEGIVYLEELKLEFEKVSEYIDDVEKLVKNVLG